MAIPNTNRRWEEGLGEHAYIHTHTLDSMTIGGDRKVCITTIPFNNVFRSNLYFLTWFLR